MNKEQLDRIKQYCDKLQNQPIANLSLTIHERRDLKKLIFRWADEQGMEIPLQGTLSVEEARR